MRWFFFKKCRVLILKNSILRNILVRGPTCLDPPSKVFRDGFQIKTKSVPKRVPPLKLKRFPNRVHYIFFINTLCTIQTTSNWENTKMSNMPENIRQMWEAAANSKIVKTGTSTNDAGEKIPWTHTHDKATGKSSIKDKFGERDATVERSSLTPHETHISNIKQRAKTQGRPLTADENTAIARHQQNAVDAARRSKPQ